MLSAFRKKMNQVEAKTFEINFFLHYTSKKAIECRRLHAQVRLMLLQSVKSQDLLSGSNPGNHQGQGA